MYSIWWSRSTFVLEVRTPFRLCYDLSHITFTRNPEQVPTAVVTGPTITASPLLPIDPIVSCNPSRDTLAIRPVSNSEIRRDSSSRNKPRTIRTIGRVAPNPQIRTDAEDTPRLAGDAGCRKL